MTLVPTSAPSCRRGDSPASSGEARGTLRRRLGQPVRRPRPRWDVASGALVAAVVIGYAIVVPFIIPLDPVLVDFSLANLPPSPQHWFGSDPAGRDLFVRTAVGLRLSLLIALVSAASAAVVGSLIGAISAVAGGIVDQVVMRLVDSVNALPHLLLGIVIVTFFRGSLAALIIAIAATHWTQVARVVRACVLPLRSADHVRAAINHGYSRAQLLRHHIGPAVLPQALISLTLLVPHAVWHEATLSFLGLGVPPHEPSLGVLLNSAQQGLHAGAWWLLLFPAGSLIGLTVGVAAIGRGLRDHAISRGAST